MIRTHLAVAAPPRPPAHLSVVVLLALGFGVQSVRGQIEIVHDTSSIPPRALEALELDPLSLLSLDPDEVGMNVGVRIDLSLHAPGGGTITEVQWTVPGSIIKDFSIASERDFRQGYLSECSVLAMEPADLEEPSISFYFTEPGESEVVVNALVDGVPASDSLTFEVIRHPKAEIFYATGPGSSVFEDVDSSGTVDYTDFLLFPDFFGKDTDPAGLVFGRIGEHAFWHEIIFQLFVDGFGLCSDTTQLCEMDPDCPAGETCELFGTGEDGGDFFRFHRGFIQKADCWRGIFGYPCVKVYATAPDYVPTGDDIDHHGLCEDAGTPCEEDSDCPGAGEVCDSRVGTGVIDRGRQSDSHGFIQELPATFTLAGDGMMSLADYLTEDELAHDILPYHDSGHGLICNSGDFTFPSTTPADPIFWRFHFMLTKVFELWQFLKLDDGSAIIGPLECTSPEGRPVFFPDPALEVATTCSDPLPDPCTPPSGSNFPLGVSDVQCTVADVMMLDESFPEDPELEQGTTQDVSFGLEVVDTTPPDLVCPEDATVECGTPTDPDATGLPMVMDLCDSTPGTGFEDEATAGSCAGELVIERTWTATDASGNDATCVQTVEVVDTTGPDVTCDVETDTLWPPNHGLVDVGLSFEASDECDPDPPTIEITVTSDEHPSDELGAGGPTHCPDALIEDDGTVLLRAERSGVGDGRVYAVTVQATDACGNVGTCTAEVSVAHDQRPGGVAIDSGQTFDATTCSGELPLVFTDSFEADLGRWSQRRGPKTE